MISKSRRTFMVQTAGMCAALAVTQGAQAADPLVDEKSEQAKNYGYHSKATSVDAAHFPTYKAGQQCSSCRFYTGTGNSASGPCMMFPGKTVAAEGWCALYAKKS